MLFAKSPLKESWLGVGELYFVRAACVYVSLADFFALASVCRSTSGTIFQTVMTNILLNIVCDLWFIWCSLHDVPTVGHNLKGRIALF
jgi:hypothetical protein